MIKAKTKYRNSQSQEYLNYSNDYSIYIENLLKITRFYLYHQPLFTVSQRRSSDIGHGPRFSISSLWYSSLTFVKCISYQHVFLGGPLKRTLKFTQVFYRLTFSKSNRCCLRTQYVSSKVHDFILLFTRFDYLPLRIRLKSQFYQNKRTSSVRHASRQGVAIRTYTRPCLMVIQLRVRSNRVCTMKFERDPQGTSTYQNTDQKTFWLLVPYILQV